MNPHVMIDLETLDTGPHSVVTALGAVMFDPRGGELGRRLYAVTSDWADQQRYGRTISGDTVAWWFEQSREAQQSMLDPTGTTRDLLERFTDYLDGFDEPQIWGNGSDFDNVILRNLYAAYGVKVPWSHRGNRCYRTAEAMLDPGRTRRRTQLGTHHNALDDAVSQALHLQQLWNAPRWTK